MPSKTPAPYITLDPFDKDFYADMHGRLRELRTKSPLVRAEGLGTWCTTTFAGSQSILADQALGKRGLREMLTGTFGDGSHIGDFLFFTDPPEQTRLRRLVSREFTARLIDTLAETSRAVCGDLTASLVKQGGGDIVTELAWRIPVPVIGSLFGIPPGDSKLIEKWGRDLFLATDMTRADALEPGKSALADMYRYFSDHLSAVRGTDRGEFLARLEASGQDADRLSEHEVIIMAMQLVIGGYDTTANQIANGVYLLLSHPAQLEALQSDWTLIRPAVEEILRYEPATPFIGRQVLHDITIEGTVIAAGEFIGPLIAAANRDPAVFPNPDAFDIQAPRPQHLTFGKGIHFCLGHRLARLNLAIALSCLLRDRTRQLELVDSHPEWRPSFLFRGLEGLQARVS
jgi:cytochrome P450